MIDDPDRLLALARCCAPHSLRIRKMLELWRRGGATNLQRDGFLRGLHRLVVEFLTHWGIDENGEFLTSAVPDAKRRNAAEALLRDYRFCWSRLFQAKQAHANRVGGYRPLARWLAHVVKALQQKHIPVYALTFVRARDVQAVAFVQGAKDRSPDDEPHCFGMAVDLVHCTLPRLPETAWAVLHEVGDRAARRFSLKLVRPDPDKPWHWEVEDWWLRQASSDLVGEPVRVAQARMSSPPPGERQELLRFYGIIGEAGREQQVPTPDDLPIGEGIGVEFDPDDPTTWEVNLFREEAPGAGPASRGARTARYDPSGSEIGCDPGNVYFDDDIDGDWDEQFL